jgi:hypothetical protein
MGAYTYSPETNAKIEKLCRDCAVLVMLDYPNYSLDVIDEFLKTVTNFVKDNFPKLGAKEYLLVLDFSDTAIASVLNADIIIDEIKNDNNLFIINKNLNVLHVERIDRISNVSVAKYSRDNKCVLLLIHNGAEVSFYSNGIPIEQRNLNHPSALPVLNKRFSRAAEDYKVSLIEFYKEKVRTNLTDHWHNPQKRVLRGGKTEDIFQNALVQWLMDNLSAKKINFKVKKISADETDIEIIKHGGDTFLLELKWLGKNENSNYPVSKLTAAIDQVENYLESDLEVLEATLVVYDGRPQADFNKLIFVEEESGNWKELKECDSKKLSFRGSAFVFYLISETASKRKSA